LASCYKTCTYLDNRSKTSFVLFSFIILAALITDLERNTPVYHLHFFTEIHRSSCAGVEISISHHMELCFTFIHNFHQSYNFSNLMFLDASKLCTLQSIYYCPSRQTVTNTSFNSWLCTFFSCLWTYFGTSNRRMERQKGKLYKKWSYNVDQWIILLVNLILLLGHAVDYWQKRRIEPPVSLLILSQILNERI
jgi:hypothetical protein